MKFTVVFPSHESQDLSYGLVFVPCPVWVRGHEHILNLNPESAEYQIGSIRRLLGQEKISTTSKAIGKECILIIHREGHGQQKDLDTLTKDLEAEGFVVSKVYFKSDAIFVPEQ